MQRVNARFYVGVDPSLTSTGLAIIHIQGTQILRKTCRIETKSMRGIERLIFIREQAEKFLNQHVELCEQDQVQTCIEGPSLYSVNQPDKLGQVRGVLQIVLADNGLLPVVEVPPLSLKKFATGNGNADKDKMIAAAIPEWGELSDDEADAAWLSELAWSLSEDRKHTRKQLEAIKGIREMSETKTRTPVAGGLNI